MSGEKGTLPSDFNESQDLQQSKRGTSLKLSQYYRVFRVYRDELKKRPEELRNVLLEIGIRMETDYICQYSPNHS